MIHNLPVIFVHLLVDHQPIRVADELKHLVSLLLGLDLGLGVHPISLLHKLLEGGAEVLDHLIRLELGALLEVGQDVLVSGREAESSDCLGETSLPSGRLDIHT